MMSVSPCSNCGGSDLYRSVQSTPANGLFGPVLLPGLPGHRFRVVVCRDCGLTRLFASTVDTEALSSGGWERVVEGQATGPLGLKDA
jgi:predicted nucleic-acid-binding Zn-ribbon protein